jgi:hypothetical protein
MFKFLKRAFHGPATILAECERESERAARALPYFISNPRDDNLRRSLLQKAAGAGLSEHHAVKRLALVHRLIDAVTVDPTPTPEMLDPLVEQAKRYQLEDSHAVRLIQDHLALTRLKQNGPQVVRHDQQGRAIYFQCTAEFKNEEGRFEVREDGVTYTGDVAIEIRWSDVVHANRTTHTYQGDTRKAIVLQEGKRRSPTRFAFPLNREAEYACEVTMLSWERRQREVAEPEAKERRSQALREHPQAIGGSMTNSDPEAERPTTDSRAGITIEFPSSGHFGVAVVGESRRQATLRSLAGDRLKRGESVVFTAAVVPEPANSFDPLAVAVHVHRGGQVGYLSREDAAEYKAVTAALIAENAVGLCPARLIGGTITKPSIGVMLDLADPSTLLACIGPIDSPF